MKLHPLIKEPELQFYKERNICPRNGIATHGVFDLTRNSRRSEILLGAVGTQEGIEKFNDWLERCRYFVDVEHDESEKVTRPNLHLTFYGFNEDSGFRLKVVFGDDNQKRINPQDISAIIKEKNTVQRIDEAVEKYFSAATFLDENRPVDVIVCIIPDDLFESISKSISPGAADEEEEDEVPTLEEIINGEKDDDEENLEHNFRRQLKAKGIVHLNAPLQLVVESTFDKGKKKKQQIEATRAWNFFTALYYKMRNTIPWKMVVNPNEPPPCYVGISFYRSRNWKNLRTSMAQVFDERGHGIILRGAEVLKNKNDPRPFLTYDQSTELLTRALDRYKLAMEQTPARLVVHKSSNFRTDEIEGFRTAAQSHKIDFVDFVTVMDSNLRLFRYGLYPPFRGTHFELEPKTHIIYTKGSVDYYQTYPGMYVPEPLELRIVETTQSAKIVCQEILALTKMNWNNTLFDGKYPITLGCGRKVGEIMKYLEEQSDQAIKSQYCYYM
jgi:hypothetical protein